jgi:hypothetical protein
MAEVTVLRQMFAEILSLSPGCRRRLLRHDSDGCQIETDEGRGAPGMKQSNECRTGEPGNPNDWLRPRLVAPEFYCDVPR